MSFDSFSRREPALREFFSIDQELHSARVKVLDLYDRGEISDEGLERVVLAIDLAELKVAEEAPPLYYLELVSDVDPLLVPYPGVLTDCSVADRVTPVLTLEDDDQSSR